MRSNVVYYNRLEIRIDTLHSTHTSRLTFAGSSVLLSAVVAALYGVQASTRFTVMPM